MEEKYQLSNTVDFIEGETEARDLIYTLADEITSAIIPQMDGSTVKSNWEEVARSEGSLYVEYSKVTTTTQSMYKHTDGKFYPVYKIQLTGYTAQYATAEGVLRQVTNEGVGRSSTGGPTGNKLNLNTEFTYVDRNGKVKTITTFNNPDARLVFIPNEEATYGYDTHFVEQGFYDEDGKFVLDDKWDNFVDVGIIEHDDLSFFANKVNTYLISFSVDYWGDQTSRYAKFDEIFKQHSFSNTSYVANPVLHAPRTVVLKATPDVPNGITPRSYFVKLSQRMDDYNYFDINYGVGFEVISEPTGDPVKTYAGICDPETVRKEGEVPKILDQLAAHLYYEKAMAGNPAYKPAEAKWEMDITNTKEMVSPTSHCFTGRNSTTTWVVDKIRRPDFLVRYWLSVNNSRVAMITEGDPAPSINDYYRTFSYIGKVTPFNKYDHAGNFGVTTGMGHLIKTETSFVEKDIKEDTYEYGKWGEYTSNGMWSMSMFNTRSNVFFQAHHPAFLTQLPDYSSAGTLPPALKRLVLDDDRFQTSIWTSKYHGSPIYMVHRSEGYRGFMDGAVVIEDHNIVNGDELVVDTHILKDEDNPSLGTWTEVYKFFSLNTPVSLFNKYSPAPGMVSVAILKEIY